MDYVIFSMPRNKMLDYVAESFFAGSPTPLLIHLIIIGCSWQKHPDLKLSLKCCLITSSLLSLPCSQTPNCSQKRVFVQQNSSCQLRYCEREKMTLCIYACCPHKSHVCSLYVTTMAPIYNPLCLPANIATLIHHVSSVSDLILSAYFHHPFYCKAFFTPTKSAR